MFSIKLKNTDYNGNKDVSSPKGSIKSKTLGAKDSKGIDFGNTDKSFGTGLTGGGIFKAKSGDRETGSTSAESKFQK